MAIVTSYDWESDTWTHNGDNPARIAWRAAVAEIAEKAKDKLPECNGRVESAVKIVLAGDVELLADGTARVASQSNGTTAYHVMNGECSCKDYPKAPHNFCKHRLSAAIARRAHELVQAKLAAASTGQAEPSIHKDVDSHVPAPVHSIPPQFLVEIQGKQFVTFHGLLAMAHAQGLTSLKVDFLSVTADLALAHAVATFQDGRVFEESGDATPANVAPRVKAHFARMALTRAKARTLRDALNLAMVCAEELE